MTIDQHLRTMNRNMLLNYWNITIYLSTSNRYFKSEGFGLQKSFRIHAIAYSICRLRVHKLLCSRYMIPRCTRVYTLLCPQGPVSRLTFEAKHATDNFETCHIFSKTWLCCLDKLSHTPTHYNSILHYCAC